MKHPEEPSADELLKVQLAKGERDGFPGYRSGLTYGDGYKAALVEGKDAPAHLVKLNWQYHMTRTALEIALAYCDAATHPTGQYQDQREGLYRALTLGTQTRASSSHEALRTAWQPIETAPRDGTRIWLGDVGGVVTGYWSPPLGAWRCDWNIGALPNSVHFPRKPTHWMPLPVAPALPDTNCRAAI